MRAKLRWACLATSVGMTGALFLPWLSRTGLTGLELYFETAEKLGDGDPLPHLIVLAGVCLGAVCGLIAALGSLSNKPKLARTVLFIAFAGYYAATFAAYRGYELFGTFRTFIEGEPGSSLFSGAASPLDYPWLGAWATYGLLVITLMMSVFWREGLPGEATPKTRPEDLEPVSGFADTSVDFSLADMQEKSDEYEPIDPEDLIMEEVEDEQQAQPRKAPAPAAPARARASVIDPNPVPVVVPLLARSSASKHIYIIAGGIVGAVVTATIVVVAVFVLRGKGAIDHMGNGDKSDAGADASAENKALSEQSKAPTTGTAANGSKSARGRKTETPAEIAAFFQELQTRSGLIALADPSDIDFVDHDGGWGWYERCHARLKEKKLPHALHACQQGLKDPANKKIMAALLYDTGRIYERFGESAVAAEFYKKSLAVRPNQKEVERRLSRLR